MLSRYILTIILALVSLMRCPHARQCIFMAAGTTCATVLTQSIFMEGCTSVAAGVNVMDLRTGINMAVDAVIADLKNKALMISTPEEITQVRNLRMEKLDSCTCI